MRIHCIICHVTAALALAPISISGAGDSGLEARGPRANYFPNVTLRTQDDKEVRFYEDLLQGKTVVINFMYTTCKGACPGMMSNLLQVQKIIGVELGKEIHMYTISLDPENDTPAVLKEYMEKIGVGPGWTFLTGKKDDIELLRRKLGFTDPDPELDADRSTHSGMVLFGNEPLDRWSSCPALLKPEQIVRVAQSVKGRRTPD